MSKTFPPLKIDDPLLLRRNPNGAHAVWSEEKVQPTILVRELQWGLRVGVFADDVRPPTFTRIGRNAGATAARRRRRQINLAGAAGIGIAAGAFGQHQYHVGGDK